MNTSKLFGVAVIAIAAATSTAWISYQARQHQKYADVVRAKLVTTNVEGPRERCYEETVTRSSDDTPATFSKAVSRALRPHKSAQADDLSDATASNARSSSPASIEQRCETVYDSEQQPAGYDVEYHYAGKAGVVHMDHDPGQHIPVENGELVLNNDEDDGATPG